MKEGAIIQSVIIKGRVQMSKTKNDFNGQILKQLREKIGLSQEKLVVELANKADFQISKHTIYKWENGTTAPNVIDLVVVAKFFHVPIQVFFK